MKKNGIKSTITSAFRKANIRVKKHSPEILIAVGVVGTVASAVMACKATTKVGKVIEQTKEDIDEIHVATEKGVTPLGESYSSDDSKKDLTIVYVQTGVKLAKLYAPSVALGTLSLTAIITSNQILRKRNVALATAYATVDKTFKEYRERVVERFGKEVDDELRYNIKAKNFEEVVTDPETGEEKKVDSTVKVAEPNENPYLMFFDEKTSKAYENNYDYNRMTLKAVQQLMNDKLHVDGFLFLSDVYEELGIQRTKLSQSVGWVDKPGYSNGDGYVDFRVQEVNREKEDGTYEKALLLDFNVDGYILDLI
jgi:hypothetical protein